MTSSKWAAALQEALLSDVETVPDGFLSTSGIAKETNKSESYTHKLIRGMLKNGKVERRMFRVLTGGGVKSLPFYRLVEPTVATKKARSGA